MDSDWTVVVAPISQASSVLGRSLRLDVPPRYTSYMLREHVLMYATQRHASSCWSQRNVKILPIPSQYLLERYEMFRILEYSRISG